MSPPEAPLPALNVVVDDAGTVSADVPCRRCGYNLRGLNQHGRCPECASAIGLSILGDLLRFADPAWVAKLGRGIRFILWGLLISILASVAGTALLLSVGMPSVLLHPVNLAAGMFGLYGAWLLTTPDPSGLGEDRYVTARKVTRYGLLAGLTANVFLMLGEGGFGPPWLYMLLAALALLAGLAAAIGEYAKFVLLEKLLLRVPEPKLARRAIIVRRGFVIFFGLAVVFGGILSIGVAMAPVTLPAAVGTPPAPAPAGGATTAPPAISPGAAAGRTGARPLLGIGGCGAGIAQLGIFIFFVLALFLQYRAGKAFRAQAALARETWQPAGAR